MTSIIVAYSKNGVIGNTGTIPWRLSDDLKRFKTITSGHTIIMGRKTFESIGHALPKRRNIVVTRSKTYKADGIEVANSLQMALDLAKGDNEVFIIGGGEIYKEALPKVQKIYATIIDKTIEGDTTFPRVNLNRWQLDELEKHTNVAFNYYYATYTRRSKKPELYFIDAGRTLEQVLQMEDLERRGVCVFCEHNFKKEHREPIEIETEHWMVTKNDYPYEDTKLHLLFVPKKHANFYDDLEDKARDELGLLLHKIEQRYKPKSYGMFMRVGDFMYNGASVHHLHGHILVGDHELDEFKGIRVKLGSKPEL